MQGIVYTGTYTEKNSEGMYTVSFQDGKVSDPKLFCHLEMPKYAAYYKDEIAVVCVKDGKGGVVLVRKDGNVRTGCFYDEHVPCYVAVDNDRIYTSNYHDGTVHCLEEKDGKLEILHKTELGKMAGCHQVIVMKDRIFVPALNQDRIAVLDRELHFLDEIKFEKGTGPRHGVLSPDGKHLYQIAELDGRVFDIDPESLQIRRDFYVLGNPVRGGAAIRYSDTFQKIYLTIREVNIIAVIDPVSFTVEQIVPCAGDHPRDMIVIGKYLLVSLMLSDEIESYELEEDGKIKGRIDRLTVPEAVSMLYEENA